jgi:hypothetical protein
LTTYFTLIFREEVMKYLSKSLVILLALVLPSLLWQEAPAATGDTLKVMNSSGWPGLGGYNIPIRLKNLTTLRALVFRLQANPDSLIITAVNTTPRTAGYQVDAVQIPKGARILLTPLSGTTPFLTRDSTAIINIQVSVKSNTPGGTKATVTVDSIVAANSTNQSASIAAKSGYFWFGTKGDVKYDASINLFDVLRLIDIALGIQPAPSLYELWAGDLNIVDGAMVGDGLIDVIDISIALDLVVSGVLSKQPLSEPTVTSGSVRLDIPDLPQNYKGEMDVPIYYRASAPVSGIEIIFKTDSKTYLLAPPKKTALSKSMTLQAAMRGDEMRVILCSTDGKPLPAGEGELLTLPVNVLSQLSESAVIEIKNAAAGSQGASRMETFFGQSHMQVQAPESFALTQNSPNPFNMSTTFRYEIPKSLEGSVETKVLVYNTQGQLVRKLEDRQRSAGRYTIIWNGQDDSGRYISSGIYFYKLIAGDVVLTKKMAVMK